MNLGVVGFRACTGVVIEDLSFTRSQVGFFALMKLWWRCYQLGRPRDGQVFWSKQIFGELLDAFFFVCFEWTQPRPPASRDWNPPSLQSL